MRALLAALLVAALAGAAVAHEDNKDEDINKCRTENTELPTSDQFKEYVSCILTGIEVISQSGEIDQAKCEAMTQLKSKKREDKAEGMKQCCSTVQGESSKDKAYNLVACMNTSLGGDALWSWKKGGKGEATVGH